MTKTQNMQWWHVCQIYILLILGKVNDAFSISAWYQGLEISWNSRFWYGTVTFNRLTLSMKRVSWKAVWNGTIHTFFIFFAREKIISLGMFYMRLKKNIKNTSSSKSQSSRETASYFITMKYCLEKIAVFGWKGCSFDSCSLPYFCISMGAKNSEKKIVLW